MTVAIRNESGIILGITKIDVEIGDYATIKYHDENGNEIEDNGIVDEIF